MVLQPILSLCSGAGGLDLGVHDALGGCARTICYVEHETTACEVLAARIADGALDDAPIWTDLHTFDGRPLRGKVAGVIGGYPCQPFSVAGKRLGTADPRHLWPSISRILSECEPDWCLFENVAGHLRLGYWDVVRPDLERLGYRVAEGIFTAAEVGAPHRRERLFILAHRDKQCGNLQQRVNGAKSEPGSGAVADAGRTGPDGRATQQAREQGAGPQRQSGRDSGILAPFPPGPGDSAAWARILAERPDLAPAIESPVRSLAPGLEPLLDLPRAAQLRLTGNGVVPQCASLAFRTLWRELT